MALCGLNISGDQTAMFAYQLLLLRLLGCDRRRREDGDRCDECSGAHEIHDGLMFLQDVEQAIVFKGKVD